MKKLYINLLGTIVLSWISTSSVLARVFIQNNYGQKIQYVEAPAQNAHHLKPTILGNGASMEIARQASAYNIINPSQHFLSISTIGGSYYDISNTYNQIKQEQIYHPDADAIIMIYPRFGGYGWYTQIEWINASSK